jgi:hypothetical protein
MMKKIIYLFLIILGWSCTNSNEIEKEGVKFVYSKHVKDELANSIFDYFIQQKKENDWIGLDKIESVKIDSAYYSYLLYLNCKDIDSVLISERRKGRYQAFAKFLSDELLDSARVHVFLTDNSFKVKEGLPFNPKSFVVIEKYYVQVNGKTKIQVKGDFIDVLATGLREELLVNKPELFKDSDTLEIHVNKNNDHVKVNIYINPNKVNIDTLIHQFQNTEPLIYDILFSYTPTYFNIVDKYTKQNLQVLAHRLPLK